MKRQTFKFGSIAAAAAVLAVAAGTTYSVVHHSVPFHVAVANTLGTRLGHSESTNSSAQVAPAANSNTDNTVSRNSIDNSTATPLNAMHNSNSASKNPAVSKPSAGAMRKSAEGTYTKSHTSANGTGAAASPSPPAQSTSTTTPSPPVQIPPNAATSEQVIKGLKSILGRLVIAPPSVDPSAKCVTLTDADHMILNAVGATASAAPYEVGGTPLAWGNAMGINAGITDQILTQTDLTTLLQNLSYLGNGYKTLSSGTYQLGHFLTGNYFVGSKAPPAQAKSDQVTAVQWYDSITVTVKNGVMTVSTPSLSMNNSCYFLLQGMNSGVTYSLDNGNTWTSLPYAYQSKEPSQGGLVTPPERILFRFTQFDSPHSVDVEFYTPYETATPFIGALLSYDQQNGFQV